MKKNIVWRLLVNIILYCAIAIALYCLYSPLNSDPNNKTRSAIHFVYQQF